MLNRKTEIKKKYLDKIKERTQPRQFYVYINRKQITAHTYDELIEKLYNMEYGYTLEGLYPEWLRWKRDNSKTTTKTLREYTYLWNAHLKDDVIIHKHIVSLHSNDFLELFERLTCKYDLTKKRFTNIKSLLNGIYRYAITKKGIISTNPIREIDCRLFTFKAVNHSDDVFTIEERAQLLKHLANNSDMYALAICFDFHCTLRIGELLSLKWSDIEGDNIHVQSQQILDISMDDELNFSSKTYKDVDHIKGYADAGFRYIPLTDGAKEILTRAKEVNPTGKYIFMKNDRQLTTDTFNRRLKAYCREIGIKPCSSHKIRFTVASILYENGMPLADLQRMLGHTTIAMTLHYLRKVTPNENASNLMQNTLG
ncbi:MAG: site-specific integrase [Lachnospiraceae bacterium]|nr:site-specific integrase [Lachnospiraceae bacterium]